MAQGTPFFLEDGQNIPTTPFTSNNFIGYSADQVSWQPINKGLIQIRPLFVANYQQTNPDYPYLNLCRLTFDYNNGKFDVDIQDLRDINGGGSFPGAPYAGTSADLDTVMGIINSWL